jgi:hypothetical protein
LRAKLEYLNASSAPSADTESKKLKQMHEQECRELRLTIKSLVSRDRC